MEVMKALQLKPTLFKIVKVFALLHLGEIVPGSSQLYDVFDSLSTGCIKKKFTVGKGLLMQKAFNSFNKIL